MNNFFNSRHNFYFFGILLGLANFFTNFVDYIRPLPVITLVALIFFGLNTILRHGNEPIPFFLKILVPYGIVLSLVRFYVFYSAESMVMNPILRHFASLTLGLILLSIFIQVFKTKDFFEVSKGVVFGSTLPLVFGIIQYLAGHDVGGSKRVQSFFSEPSYYGEYLVLIVIPCLVQIYMHYKNESTKMRWCYNLISGMLLINLIISQSGTLILRLVTLLFLFLLFFPISKKIKLSAFILISLIIGITSLSNESYVFGRFQNALQILENPNSFFKYHTFYDRFYPIFSSLKSMSNYFFIGTGFGGDYFEFKNLYPLEVQPELLSRNPSRSYFFSFGPKLFLYFGIFGIFIYFYFLQLGRRCHDKIIMISFFSVMVSSLWSISNFSLPYIWFWLALILHGQRTEQEKNVDLPYIVITES